MRAVRGLPREVPAVAATCLLTVLVAWAALIGPGAVFTGPGPTPGGSTPRAPEPAAERSSRGQDGRTAIEQTEPPWWVEALVWAFGLLVLLGILSLLLLGGRAVLQAWRQRRSPLERREDAGFETLPAGARVEAAVRADAAAQDAVLAEGSARNAIVAAWHRFELQGESAGVRRREWETSSEFTLRMLDEAGADSAAVTRLGELYREARFSRHDVGEAEREAAVAALAAIRTSLGSLR